MQLQFLIIEENRAASLRLGRLLAQRFPQAALKEFSSFAMARGELAGSGAGERACVTIVGRGNDLPTVALVRAVRACQPATRVIALGVPVELSEAAEAGADAVLDHEAWLMLAPTIERLVRADERGA